MNSSNKFSSDIQKEYDIPIMTLEHFQDIEFDPHATAVDYMAKMANHALQIVSSSEEHNQKEENKDNRGGKSSFEPIQEKRKMEESPERPRRRRRSTPMSDSEVYYSPNPPPELPPNSMLTLQDCTEDQVIEELQLVMQKKLYSTDLNPHHNRLSMPINKLRCMFLTEEETRDLELQDERGVKRMEVDAIDPSLYRCKLSLRRWEMKKKKGDPSIIYVLTKNWNQIVRTNFLKEGDVLQIYTARADRKLWFLLVRLPSIEDLRQSE